MASSVYDGYKQAVELLTFGHGTASETELAALVAGAQIDAVVDIRTVPKSRRHPHVARERMEHWMPQLSGAAYRWEPDLGGFRKTSPASENTALRNESFRGYADYMQTPQFAAALERLLEQLGERQTAIMCSETLWWRCHRRLVADAVTLLHGIGVFHLAPGGKRYPHVPTAGVRVLNGAELRYDVAA